MKVAVCLHGYFGTISTNDFSTSKGGFEHIQQEIVSKCDEVDFYVHCWQPNCEEQVNNLYFPKRSIFEQQKDFAKVCKDNRIHQNYIDEHFPRKKTMYKNATAERILSFYYSRCESIKLALEEEYDFIITTRFDVSTRGGSEVRYINFTPELESDFLYTTNWNQKNVGYGDMWFYGSNKIMLKYSDIYRQAINDFKPLSKYEKTLTTGWPDSNYFNVFDPNDQRQFTNECERIEKSKNLMHFPKWRITDSHLHHKWFCMQNDLYHITRWL